MKLFYTFIFSSIFILSCSISDDDKGIEEIESVNEEIEKTIEELETVIQEEKENPDNLFQLNISGKENQVIITPPVNSDFSVPDEDEENYVDEFSDFNADGKEDVMVYMGACGTGGCVHAIFINQYENYYKLAFNDYLKGPSLEPSDDGSIIVSSYEEVDAYDPSKLYVNSFKFNHESYTYELDTHYIYYDTIP